jgi:hypothetical protein
MFHYFIASRFSFSLLIISFWFILVSQHFSPSLQVDSVLSISALSSSFSHYIIFTFLASHSLNYNQIIQFFSPQTYFIFFSISMADHSIFSPYLFFSIQHYFSLSVCSIIQCLFLFIFVYYIQSFSASNCLFCFTSASPSHSFSVSQFLVFHLTGVATIGRCRWSVSGIADEDTSLHHDWRLGDVYHLLFTWAPLSVLFSQFSLLLMQGSEGGLIQGDNLNGVKLTWCHTMDIMSSSL